MRKETFFGKKVSLRVIFIVGIYVMHTITTKKGDFGLTHLGNTKCVPKDQPAITALGDLDELNAALGIAKCHATDPDFRGEIESWQKTLITLSGIVANYNTEAGITEALEHLEKFREKLESQVKIPHIFILPGKNFANAYFHLARTICRRAERSVCALLDENPSFKKSIVPFLNRLSDVLWLMALKLENTAIEP